MNCRPGSPFNLSSRLSAPRNARANVAFPAPSTGRLSMRPPDGVSNIRAMPYGSQAIAIVPRIAPRARATGEVPVPERIRSKRSECSIAAVLPKVLAFLMHEKCIDEARIDALQRAMKRGRSMTRYSDAQTTLLRCVVSLLEPAHQCQWTVNGIALSLTASVTEVADIIGVKHWVVSHLCSKLALPQEVIEAVKAFRRSACTTAQGERLPRLSIKSFSDVAMHEQQLVNAQARRDAHAFTFAGAQRRLGRAEQALRMLEDIDSNCSHQGRMVQHLLRVDKYLTERSAALRERRGAKRSLNLAERALSFATCQYLEFSSQADEPHTAAAVRTALPPLSVIGRSWATEALEALHSDVHASPDLTAPSPSAGRIAVTLPNATSAASLNPHRGRDPDWLNAEEEGLPYFDKD